MILFLIIYSQTAANAVVPATAAVEGAVHAVAVLAAAAAVVECGACERVCPS